MNDDNGTLSLSAALLALCTAWARPSRTTRTVALIASDFAAFRAKQRVEEHRWRAHLERFDKARAEAQNLVPADVQAALNLLGLSPQCTRDELKRAYRKKASLAHVDRGGTHADMLAVNAARACIERWRAWA